MKCWNHPDQDAPYTCAKCGNSICEKCSTRFQNTIFCTECAKKAAQARTNNGVPAGAKQSQQNIRQTAKPKKNVNVWLVGSTIVLGAIILVAIISIIQTSSPMSSTSKISQTPQSPVTTPAPTPTPSATPPVVKKDTSPPVITGVFATSAQPTDAQVGWIMNEPTNSQVEYGKTTQYGSSTQSIAGSSIIISNLEAGTTYHYRVRSKDNAGNETITDDYSFTTSPSSYTPPVSRVLPTILSFTSNPSCTTLGKSIVLSWTIANATSASISGYGDVPVSGSIPVYPSGTGSITYSLTAMNSIGNSYANTTVLVGNNTQPTYIPPNYTSPASTTTAPPNTSTIKINAMNLWVEYKYLNAVAAAAKYKDKLVQISGVATKAGTDVLGDTYIIYGNDAYSYGGIRCTFNPQAANDVASLSIPGNVTIQGICKDYVLWVNVEDCIVINAPTSTPTPTTPPASLPLPTIQSFTANPSSITAGGTTTLTWNTLNATSANIAGFGTVPVTGSLPVNTTGTGSITFNLTATNSAGSSFANTTISVGNAPIPTPTPSGSPPIAALYLSKSNIPAGDSATLSWMTSGATSISIDDGVKNLVDVKGASGSITVSPSSTTNYTLTATNSDGSVSDTVQLAVKPSPAPIIWPTISDFHCSQSSVIAGSQAKLYWTVTDADTAWIDNGIGSVGSSGTTYIYPTATTTYTLTASKDSYTIARTVTVNVTSPLSHPSFPFTPPAIPAISGQKLLGLDTITHIDDNCLNSTFHLDQYIASQTGNITMLRVFCVAAGNIKLAIYADSNGEPGLLLNSINTSTSVNYGWNSIPIAPTPVTAGTKYWLAMNAENIILGAQLSANNNANRRFKIGVPYSSFTFPSQAGTGFSADSYICDVIIGWGQ